MKNASLNWRGRTGNSTDPKINTTSTGSTPKRSKPSVVGKTHISGDFMQGGAPGGPKLASYTQRRMGHGKGK